MAFTFQINDSVRFLHDETLLKKAEGYRPTLLAETHKPVRLVRTTTDDAAFGGVGIEEDERQIEKLETYSLKRGDEIILDFGAHCVGHFSVNIDAVGSPMDAPLYLRFFFAEVPAELTSDTCAYDGWLSRSWIQEEYLHLDELPQRVSLPRRYSFRYVRISIVDTSPKWQVVFSNPRVETESAVRLSQATDITIEDEKLKHISEVSVKTLADCMQDVFEDGPKRDRRLWLGDLRLMALANYATFDHTDLVKRCLYLFAGMAAEDGRIPADVFVRPKNVPDDTFLYDYSLFFISTLDDYLKVHPDEALLKDLYPTAKKQMDVSLSYVDEDGRLVLAEDYPVFIDWSNEFDKGTAAQAVLIYGLRQFLSLAERMGDPDREAYQKKLKQLVAFARLEYFDSDKMLFVSGEKREYNIASQVWMVLADVLSDEEKTAVMKQTIKTLFPVSGIATPYMYHHIVHALFIAKCDEEAVKLLKEYWGGMIDLGADTYWEAYDPAKPDYSPYGDPIVSSYCHAWGCSPVYLMKEYLL